MNSAWQTTSSGYWYRPRGFRRAFLGSTRKEALSTFARIRSGEITMVRLNDHEPAAALVRHLEQLYCMVKRRAGTKGYAVLSKDEFNALCSRASGRCEVSGRKFSLIRPPGTSRRPWAPSVDRIDCSKGYEADNCRLVCLIVNIAISEWGVPVLEELAQQLVGGRAIIETTTPSGHLGLRYVDPKHIRASDPTRDDRA